MARALYVWLVMGMVASVAAAEPFTLDAPASCPSADDLRARIERRHHVRLDGAVHGIEIVIERTGRGYVATLDARAITVADEVRTLRSARCDELVDAIAVIVARWASEARPVPMATLAPPPSRPRPPASDLRGPDDERAIRATSRATITPRDARPHRPGRWGGGVHFMGLSGVGALPQVNVGGELGGYVRREDRFAELAFGRWVPQTDEVSLSVVTVRAGWGPRDLPLRAWLTGELGQIRGVTAATGATWGRLGTWTAVGGGFGVAWPMAPQARLIGTVELAIPLERTQVMLRGGNELYPPAAAAARCSFGIEVGWR